jgi:glycosyltransferase involved in cell wall biosynthesis
MEAMSSGVPVIVSDKGGPKTLIGKEQEAGYAIDVKDQAKWLEKINLLIKDRKLRENLGAKGHQLISHMGIENSFEVFWKEHTKQITRRE